MVQVVLVHPDIPENTGNIGRICVGLDIKLHLVRPLGFVLDHKKIRRSGLDYWQDLDLTVHNSLKDFFEHAKDCNKYFFTTKSKQLYTKIEFQEDDFLLFGSESRGLPDEVLKEYNQWAYTIPMPGKIRSLNLANSVAVIAYEAYRQINI